jgi:hypothetical protein
MTDGSGESFVIDTVVSALLTACPAVAVLVLKLVSPLYVKVNVLLPCTVLVSWHDVAGNVAVHVPPAPSLTETVPVGVPAPGAVTLSVNPAVYGCPTTDGSGESDRPLSEVFALLTVCVAVPTLPLKLELPPYVAVIDLGKPTDVLVRLQLVAGSVIRQLCKPSLTVTVPVGVAPLGAFAVTLTFTAYDWPTTVGVPANEAAFVIVVVVAALLTVNVAVLVAPGALSFEVIGPVVLENTPVEP